MGRSPRISSTEKFILDLLSDKGEMSPSQMVKIAPRLKRNTIYVIIGRMVEKGLVESKQETKKPGQKGRPRLLYQPTGFGKEVRSFYERLDAEWDYSPAAT